MSYNKLLIVDNGFYKVKLNKQYIDEQKGGDGTILLSPEQISND